MMFDGGDAHLPASIPRDDVNQVLKMPSKNAKYTA
jgi:hypothetical protein